MRRDDATMPLGEHLDELRKRIIWALVGLVPIVFVALLFGKSLVEVLVRPVTAAMHRAGLPAGLQEVAPLETFGVYLKVSIIAAVIVGSPWILYQIWLFVAPGLYPRERRYVYFLFPLSAVLTVAGVAFLYSFIMPMILSFFLAFSANIATPEAITAPLPPGVTLPSVPVLLAEPEHPVKGQYWVNETLHQLRVCVDVVDGRPRVLCQPLTRSSGIAPNYRVGEYVKLLLSLMLAFAAGFQTPVIVLVLGWAGFVDLALLSKYRRHAILICAIVAAVLTPGDPGSMIAMMIPLYLLYELGIVLLRVFPAERVGKGLARRGEDPAYDPAHPPKREGRDAGEP